MANKKIYIKLAESVNVVLDSNTPDITKLIEELVLNRKQLDTSKITVSSDDEYFDSKGFQEMLVQIVNDYLNLILLEEIEYTKEKERLVEE